MKMVVEMLDDGIKKIELFGCMDIDGTQEIALKLSAEAAVERSFVIVDMSHVDFMASIGIGTLVSTAHALKRRNGNMVLLNPKPVVALVLERTQVHSIVPSYQTFEEAKRALFNLTSQP